MYVAESVPTDNSQGDYKNLDSLPDENDQRHSIGISRFKMTEDTRPLEYTPEEFVKICKSQIKVSSRNKAIKSKLGISDSPRLSQYNSEKFNEMAQQQLEELRKQRIEMPVNPENERTETEVVIDQNSCFSWFIVKNKGVQNTIPDYELQECKVVFTEMLNKSEKSHEAYFGLGRLMAHEGKYVVAIQHIKKALSIMPQDTIYNLWYIALNMRLPNDRRSEKQAPPSPSFLDSLICCGNREKEEPKNVYKDSYKVLSTAEKQLEVLWALMEISIKKVFSVDTNIDLPKYFAYQIKEIDDYYGYLAWSEILFEDEKEWQKGLHVLKELVNGYPDRPEAYIKLWQHYYYTVKDYEQALDISFEGFIRVADPEYTHYYTLFCINYAKSCYKMGKLKNAIEILQQKFIENPSYPIFLYHYGRICTKSEDLSFNGSAIGALQETLRLSDKYRYGCIYYWLSKAYMLSRQHIEAYHAMKDSLKHLDHSEKRKSTELKRMIQEMGPNIAAYEEIEHVLKNNLVNENQEKCFRLCKEISVYQKLTGEVLHAKLLWAQGLEEDALRELESAAYMSNTKMLAYFQLLKYLEMKKEYKTMKAIGQEMILKCKNSQVPAPVWMRAHILFAKILVKNSQVSKAIVTLKCLAKVFPILPYIEIPYTKRLKDSDTIQDISQASIIPRDSVDFYNFGSPRNSFMNITMPKNIDSIKKMKIPHSNREFLFKFLEEEAAPQPDPSVPAHGRKKVAHFSDVMKTHKSFKKFNSLAIKTEDEENLESMEPIPIMTPTPSGPNSLSGFSVSSDPTFLYKIGKYSAQYRQNINDGLCALEDYLSLLRYEKKESFKENAACKALYWKIILLQESNQNELAVEIINEIIPQLEKKNFKAKFESLQNIRANLNK
ncbi:unnamed protein product [Blepharisma stoltei]|uniref:Uncharacterized protein n=1 Tax=Blepharisma stoltei TaxID=1481888 RepID=A0AAU9JTB2_9CILI|nr:unnamed protein product [Blepharisma stoltei]